MWLQNIEKAKKEIEKLESEAREGHSSTVSKRTHDAAKKPSQANQAVDGKVSADAELAQEKDAAADVAQDLKEASLEDKSE